MNNDIAHQIGQILTEHHSGFWGRVGELLGATATAIGLWLGTAGGQFALIFDPHTWTMQTIASFCSIPAAIMYFLAKKAERDLAKRQKELLEVKPNANTSN